ncbi:3-phosphoshikimate 1-carboxyvinyltransferase [Streptococcus parauberis]|uniref:3-phosphoshikimate 1-carboxyvinyltransferase n=1 Tax=Streptococcus parauberis TaxID=1348 RepID=A0AAE4L176_9STRE|nr:3-phosphoshikimate 1-carboxyvinyltransferase [Streptococcus parauberis]MDT2731805.1 3-phosphoshikimate 1-carboxyvinyltransferase [Streptococcus parauberis]
MLLKATKNGLHGKITVPGDKSISHRSLIFGAIAEGVTVIEDLLLSEDVLATMKVFQAMGIKIVQEGHLTYVYGKGLKGLTKPNHDLDMGNSGTSMRLISGLLAGQNFSTRLVGDASLSNRPMDRITIPLQGMGAKIEGQTQKANPPLFIEEVAELKPITYHLPIASAQVKSAILLAAIQAKGQTKVIEKELTRNHTEEMIRQFGGEIAVQGKEITINGPQSLKAQRFKVPGDISSAAFWIVAALIVPGSDIMLTNVGINKTRTGVLDVVKAMGGMIELTDEDKVNQSATIRVRYSQLKATEISGQLIPRLIDELPIIALLASQAKGQTTISDAEELRVKESDRIALVTEILSTFGVAIEAKSDGMIINGPNQLRGGKVDAHLDHRLAMMAVIASLVVNDESVDLSGSQAIATSYPSFLTDLERISNG